jgi:hypothetical protein
VYYSKSHHTTGITATIFMQCREHWLLPNTAHILNLSHSSTIHLEGEKQHGIFSACNTFVYSHARRRWHKSSSDKIVLFEVKFKMHHIAEIRLCSERLFAKRRCHITVDEMTSYKANWSGPHIQSTVKT